MSYEGYEQHLCANGHLFTLDAHDPSERKCYCGAESVWENDVDQTNCESYGYIDMEQFLIEPAKYQKCNLGHSHLISKEVYRIPSESERKKARTWRDDNNVKHFCEQD